MADIFVKFICLKTKQKQAFHPSYSGGWDCTTTLWSTIWLAVEPLCISSKQKSNSFLPNVFRLFRRKVLTVWNCPRMDQSVKKGTFKRDDKRRRKRTNLAEGRWAIYLPSPIPNDMKVNLFHRTTCQHPTPRIVDVRLAYAAYNSGTQRIFCIWFLPIREWNPLKPTKRKTWNISLCLECTLHDL